MKKIGKTLKRISMSAFITLVSAASLHYLSKSGWGEYSDNKILIFSIAIGVLYQLGCMLNDEWNEN